MCRPMSGTHTPTADLWSKNVESHEIIIAENGLDDTKPPRLASFVRYELTPPGGDWAAPPGEWHYRVDQDMTPDWYNADPGKFEARARKALPEWVAEKVLLAGFRQIHAGQLFAYGTSQVTACGTSRVTAYGTSQVTAYDSSQVTACEARATVRHYNSQATKPTDRFAVMIDCTGHRAVCTVGE